MYGSFFMNSQLFPWEPFEVDLLRNPDQKASLYMEPEP